MVFEEFVVISNWTFNGGHPILLVTTVVAVGVWATVMLLFSDCCWIQPLASVIVAFTVKTPLESKVWDELGVVFAEFPSPKSHEICWIFWWGVTLKLIWSGGHPEFDELVMV